MHCTTMERIKSARKSHRCDWCAKSIDAGESYCRWRYYDSGDASTVKLHPECFDAMEEARKHEPGAFIEFDAGENPRGCNCGFTIDCKKCKSNKESQ